MRASLETSLSSIEASVSKQADRVESMIRVAYRGLSERCLGTAEEVLAMERVTNESEVKIEEQCLRLIALQQPVAMDLRRIAGALKINADLERIADLALNLAERTEALFLHRNVNVPVELADMVTFSIGMLRDARTAFVENDAELARQICHRDDELDEMNRKLIAQLVRTMEQQPNEVEGYMHVFSASRIVERIGDHATNIAEDVEYIVNGKIMRHITRPVSKN